MVVDKSTLYAFCYKLHKLKELNSVLCR